jgi:membrane protein
MIKSVLPPTAKRSKKKYAFQENVKRWQVRGQRLLSRDIWESRHLGKTNAEGRLFALLRIGVLTFQGTKRNRIPLLGAALTFYTLIGLGPLLAIGIMLSSFIVDRGEENLAVNAVVQLITFAAPQTALEIDGALEGEEPLTLAPKVAEMVNQVVEAAQSGTVGIVGSLVLFFIGIQVLSSIEGSFNSIWGVAEGRRFGERIVVYWTFITMGAVLGAAALTLLTLRTISSFFERLPFGGDFLMYFLSFSPLMTFVIVVFALAFFYRFIPNTQVHWRPALAGAAIITIAIYAYNWLSFIYVQRVVSTQSLYGSLGIMIVLMIGFYVFWLLVLLGGQLTYAVQNADYLTNENAWQNASERTREVVSLGVMLMAAERFKRGEHPILASELHNALRIPSHIVNSSISRLCAIGYLHAVHSDNLENQRDRAFLPSCPLDKINLADFKERFECYGNNEGVDMLQDSNETIRNYLELIDLNRDEAAKRTLDTLVANA